MNNIKWKLETMTRFLKADVVVKVNDEEIANGELHQFYLQDDDRTLKIFLNNSSPTVRLEKVTTTATLDMVFNVVKDKINRIVVLDGNHLVSEDWNVRITQLKLQDNHIDINYATETS